MDEQLTFEFEKRPTIKGFPELRWTGKRPYNSTQYYPAQLRESYGTETDNWMNKIFWGDNLQVMSHLLKEFRGKIDLIYIDPPFDSKADYKKRIKIKDFGNAETDSSSFEEKQYGDIWTNDEYLQFMYERLILCKELLKESGSIYLHCDPHKSHYLKAIMDEVFGPKNFLNDISWCYSEREASTKFYNWKHDCILFYSKSTKKGRTFNYTEITSDYSEGSYKKFNLVDTDGRKFQIRGSGGHLVGKQGLTLEDEKKYPDWTYRDYIDEKIGVLARDWITDISFENRASKDRTGYPTQKPGKLLEKFIKASSNSGDIVFDCFMGSGTTQAVAMKLGRKFIGADINLGAVQITTKRLISVAKEIKNDNSENDVPKYTGFEVYNVNNYDFFRNPVEARNLIIEALGIQPFPQSNVWDGELDGRMVKIMPVNRIATKADLEELKANLPYKTYEKRREENPSQPVERITIVCMGHEPDLKASLEQELSEYKLDIAIVDILRDKKDLQLKREAEAEIVRENGKLVIRSFYPMNLLQKLSLQKEYVEDWRQLVESVMIDWKFDGVVMQPSEIDIPDKNNIVKGVYDIPENAGNIKVKVTDLLSESLEKEV